MPEVVKPVVLALRGAENVHDNIAVIEQEPPRVDRTLMVVRQNPGLLQAVLHLIADGANLPFSVAGADDEVIGEAAYAPSVQQDNVASLFIAGGFDGAAGYLYRFQALFLPWH